MKNETCEQARVLEPLRQRLEQWRSGNDGGRRRMPEELWQASAQAAEEYGVWRTAKSLRLDYRTLKSRVDKRAERKTFKGEVPTFIEMPVAKGRPGNAIEVEKASGSKLRIEYQGELTGELARLSERLWRAAR